MHSFALTARKRHYTRAFTLVEMLVVIAIMSILMTAGAIGLGGLGGKGVSSGVASAESLFDEARSIALGQRVKTRVMIAENLTNNPSENYRRMLIVAQEVNPTTGVVNQNSYVLTSRGVLLPDQVFYSKNLSVRDMTNGSGTLPNVTGFSNIKAANAGTYIYYEFNAEGICTTPGASFVIGNGARSSNNSDQPRVTASGKRDFGGFVVWRNGSTSLFRSPEQISSKISTLNPGSTF
ncbi:MAG: prepilin-type N-terminal cleavage/methylation domain-containing protein [Verrucomicrobiaceae bacterium]|nr:MAG: prepilin-type N-terminal cleavage/methylation domain-containing protein [Verrucomicrobiaceae bacterium]